jgi:hypothetical protein
MVGEVSRQAAMVAYVDVFRLMCVVTLFLAPLVLVVRPPAMAGAGGGDLENQPPTDISTH